MDGFLCSFQSHRRCLNNLRIFHFGICRKNVSTEIWFLAHALRILVTGAASQTAYHLLPMLASGDVIPEQKVELILCDCSDTQDVMYGVAMELEDCAFPYLSAISTTSDFCKACKTADVIIILPPAEKTADRHGKKEVDISYSTLSQVDFKSLDIAMHPTSISQMEAATVHCRGPLSTAFAIANCVGKLHEDAMKAIQYEQRLRHEEAEFGCPPDRSVENLMLNHCDYHFGPFRIESKTQIVFVTSHDVEERSIDDIDLQSSDTYKRVFARL